MKAQLVKTFIKAAAIVALATFIANCGAMPEESITETTYQPSSQPVDPAVDAEGNDDAVLIIDNCESQNFVYDSVNNTCVEEDTDTNIINPPVTEEPTVIVDDCEAFGHIYNEIAGECETGIEPTAAVEQGEAFGFTVTPGNMHFLASWEADALVSNYTIEKWREGSSSPQETTTAVTKSLSANKRLATFPFSSILLTRTNDNPRRRKICQEKRPGKFRMPFGNWCNP